MLCDEYAQDHSYLYTNCEEQALAWGARRPRLIGELKGMDADVVCLQEMGAAVFYREFTPMLAPAYVGVFAPRPGRPDGCAVFFKVRFGSFFPNPGMWRGACPACSPIYSIIPWHFYGRRSPALHKNQTT